MEDDDDEDEDVYFSQEKDILSQDPSQTDIFAYSSSDEDEELRGGLAAHADGGRQSDPWSGQSKRQGTADKTTNYTLGSVYGPQGWHDYKAGLTKKK